MTFLSIAINLGNTVFVKVVAVSFTLSFLARIILTKLKTIAVYSRQPNQTKYQLW